MNRSAICRKRIISSMLAAAMLATMLPFSAAAEAVQALTEGEPDIYVHWEPQESAGGQNTKTVTLSAGIAENSNVQSATVEITLTAEEKTALDAGRELPTGLAWKEESSPGEPEGTDETGSGNPDATQNAEENTSVQAGDASLPEMPQATSAEPEHYILTFALNNNEENRALEQELTFTLPTGVTTQEINISKEDIGIIAQDAAGNTLEQSSFTATKQTLNFTLPVEVEPEQKPGVSVADNSIGVTGEESDSTSGKQEVTQGNTSLADFSFDLALQFPETSDDSVGEPTDPAPYSFTLTLPQGVSLPGTLSVTEDGVSITTGNTTVATFTLSGDIVGATVTLSNPAYNENNNTLTFDLTVEEETTTESAESGIIARVVDAVVRTFGGSDSRGVTGTLKFTGSAFSVNYSTLFGPDTGDSRSITLSLDGAGEAASSASITLTAPATEQEYEWGETEAKTQTVTWIDGGNTHPTYGWGQNEFHPTIKYTITHPDDTTEEGILDEPSLVELGFVDDEGNPQWPDINETNTGFSIRLPAELYTIDTYGNKTPYKVTWSFEPPAEGVSGYSFYISGVDESKKEIWRYTRTTDFTFTLDLNNGDAGEPNLEQIKDLLTEYFTLYRRDGEASGEGQQISLDRFDITYENGQVTISGLPRYQRDEEDGTVHELVYYLQEEALNEEGLDGQIPIGSGGLGGDPGDYFAIRYDNAGVENSGGSTTEVYSGGKLELTLTGETKYTAKKVWLDEGSHPKVTFDLWRYPANGTWQGASQVEYSSLGIIDPTGFVSETFEAKDAGGVADNDTYTIGFPADSETYTLPKYTPEGYRYIYAVRESLEGDGADSYDPVFGNVTINADGTETIIYDKVPYAEDGEELVEGGRADRDDFLYNGGTLTNRKKGIVSATVEKVWEAAAYQAAFDDVAVKFKLQRSLKPEEGTEPNEDWKDYKNDKGELVTYILHDFYAEKLTDSGSVSGLPQYDAEGKEYEYRWVEVAVYQGVTNDVLDTNDDGTITQDEAKDAISKVDSGVTEAEFDDEDLDKITFTLTQKRDDEAAAQEVTYISTSKYNPENNTTTVTNRIDDKIDYAVKKVWENGTTPHGITLNLYQVQSGAALGTNPQPYVSVTLTFGENGKLTDVTLNEEEDGNTETDPTKNGITISSGTDEGGAKWSCPKGTDHTEEFNTQNGENSAAGKVESWDAIIQNLPQYDEDGHLYDYILLEDTGNDAGFPTYVTERYDDGCYSTVVINGPGDNYRIMVQKAWMDDGDLLHREPVTLQAYYMGTNDTPTPIGTPITLDGVWNGFIGLSKEELTEAMKAVNFPPESDTGTGGDGGETGTGGDDGSGDGKTYTPKQIQEFIDEYIYVVETSLGGGENGDTYYVNHSGKEEVELTDVDPPTQSAWTNGRYGANNPNAIFTVETDQHRYQVTYERLEEGDGESLPGGANAFFTVTNRRLGNIDLTVKKEWNVGSTGEDTTEVVKRVAELLQAINGEDGAGTEDDTEIALAFWLDFDNKPANAEWTITRNAQIGEDGKPIGDIVHVAAEGEQVEIKALDEDDGEVPAPSVQIIIDKGMTSISEDDLITEAYFHNLPKYADDGLVVQYTVRESWVQKTTKAVGEENVEVWKEVDLDTLNNMEGVSDLIDYWSDFQAGYSWSYDANVGEDGGTDTDAGDGSNLHTQDKQSLTVTNTRRDTESVTWYKEWRDAFAKDNSLRPDIYLDVYAVMYLPEKGELTDGQFPQPTIVKVLNNYRWEVVETDTSQGGDAGSGTSTLAAYPPAPTVTEVPLAESYLEATGRVKPDNGIMLMRDGEGNEAKSGGDVTTYTVTAHAVADPDNALWSVTISGLDEYDTYGNEIKYYAVERTEVHASAYHYQAVQYAYEKTVEDSPTVSVFGNRDGDYIPNGEDDTFKENTLDLEIADAEDSDHKWQKPEDKPGNIGPYNSTDGNTYPQYALLEGNRFVNTLGNDYTITGQKIWDQLPDGYLRTDGAKLPKVTFYVYQMLQKEAEDKNITDDTSMEELEKVATKAATLTINPDDWAKLGSGTVYDYRIEYMDENAVNEDGDIVPANKDEQDGTLKPVEPDAEGNYERAKLPYYEADSGNQYVYFVREVIELADTAFEEYQPPTDTTEPGTTTDPDGGTSTEPGTDTTTGEKDGLYNVDIVSVQNGAAANVNFTNTYNSPKGALKVKKILSLPADTTEENGGFPTITFTLSRSFKVEDADGNNVSKDEQGIVDTVTIDANDVETAYKAALEKLKAEGEEVTGPVVFEVYAEPFTDLELYAPNGSKYTYTVTETKIGGYEMKAVDGDISIEAVDSAFISGATLDDNGNLSIGDLAPVELGEGKEEPENAQATFYNRWKNNKEDTVKLTGTKTWEDYENAMGTRPRDDSDWNDNTLTVTDKEDDPLNLTVQRKRPDQGEDGWTIVPDTDYTITYTKDGDDKWNFTIVGKEKTNELEKWATAGTAWTYRVTEGDIPNYDEATKVTTGKGDPENIKTSHQEVKLNGNLLNSIYTDVSFRKEWQGQDGSTVDDTYLPLDLTVTFKLQVREKNVENATWTDASDYFTDGNLGEGAAAAIKGAVTVNGETVGDNYTATLSGKINDTSKWSGTFKNLPKVVKEKEATEVTNLEYRVVEASVSYDSGTPQTFEPGTSADDGSFTYDENEPKGGLVTGAEYKKVDDTHVTTNILNTIAITVEKQWEDNDNQYETRPNSRSGNMTWESWFVLQRTTEEKPDAKDWENVELVNLYGGNTKVEEDGSRWSKTISGLPKMNFAAGGALVEYTYRVRELKPNSDGYTLDSDEGHAQVSGNIVEPDDIYYEAGNDESFDYTAEYTPGEGEVNTENNNKVTVKNSLLLKPDNGELTVTKVWHSQDGKDNTPPENASVTVQLMQKIGENGTWRGYDDPVVLDGDEQPMWTHTWKGLPGKKDEEPVYYMVEEVSVTPEEYIHISTEPDPENATFTFTNVATMSFDVTKVWNNNKEAAPTNEITVGLYRTTDRTLIGQTSDAAVEAVPEDEIDDPDPQRAVLNKSNGWKGTFNNLPKYDEKGNLYLYYALELTKNSDGTYTPVADNGSITYDGQKYHVDYNHTADDETPVAPQSTTITNTPSTSLSGTKTWVDNSNEYDTRPTDEKFKEYLKLYRTTDTSSWNDDPLDLDEEGIVLTINDNDDDTWTYTFTNLPVYDSEGGKYTYKVAEEDLTGYEEESKPETGVATDNGSDDILEGPDFTNILTGTVTITGTKTWEGGSGSTPTLKLERRLDGETGWTVVDKQPTWNEDLTQYTYTDLDKYDENGVLYEYRIREDVPNGWDVYYESDTAQNGDNTTGNKNTPVDGLNITNVKRGSLTVTKQVTGNRGDRDQQFNFSVTFTLPNGFDNANGLPTISYTKTNADDTTTTVEKAFNGNTLIVTFTLADDDSITFTNLPGGTTYDVDETNSYGHSTYPENDTGTIPPGGMATAKFVNHRSGGGGGDTPDPDEPDPEIPDEPTPGEDIPPDEPDTPDEPDNPDDPGTDIPDEPTPGEDVPPDEPGTDIPDEPTPGGDVPPDDPNTPDQPGKPGLPQTGQLWWPVLLLAAVGAVMSLVGLWNIKRYRGKHGKNKV